MSLYNIHRPKIWDDVVGQNLEKEILQKAIIKNNIFHAILLIGPKGSGKTTIGRLIAQSINCINRKDANPCLECETCISIMKKQSLDIHEIDAASNGGVDDIRKLKEASSINSKLLYQVWIIDECHMLSKGAWNAFLKTLEEPNPNTIFILATTDQDKIPETILSRCATFYFKKINKHNIFTKLKEICEKESIEYEEEALNIIANASKGGMRNALVFLEQAAIVSDGPINKEIALKITFSMDSKFVILMLKALLQNSIKTILILTSILEKQEISPKEIFQEYLDCLYAIYIYKMTDNDELLKESTTNLVEISDLIEKIDPLRLKNVINFLTSISKDLDYNPNPKYFIDVNFHRSIEIYYN